MVKMMGGKKMWIRMCKRGNKSDLMTDYFCVSKRNFNNAGKLKQWTDIRLLWFGHQAERNKSLYFHAKEFNLIQVTEQFLTFFAETNSSAWKCQWRLNKCVSWCYTVFSPLLVHPHNPSFGRNLRQPLLLSFLFQSSRNRFPERY